MAMIGMPASMIFCTGSVKDPTDWAWMATKSHFRDAISWIAARCFTASSWPSNQLTSTLNKLPQYSAAALPWTHQVDCSPPLENAAFNGVDERVAARAARTSRAPNADATPATEAAVRMPRLLVFAHRCL